MRAVKNLNIQKHGQIYDEFEALLPNITIAEQRKKASPAILPQSITQLNDHPRAVKQATDRKTRLLFQKHTMIAFRRGITILYFCWT